MQVGSSVGAGYYTSYQTERSARYGANVSRTEDWQKVIISMWEDYSDAGIYSQMQECIKLNETMEKASIQFVDFDNITLVNKSSEVFFTYSGMNVIDIAYSRNLVQPVFLLQGSLEHLGDCML